MMHYYIAERVPSETMSWATHLVKRCDSLKEAQTYLEKKMTEWEGEGLVSEPNNGELWCAQARTEWQYNGRENECVVKHLMYIFATPIFMAGGSEGL